MGGIQRVVEGREMAAGLDKGNLAAEVEGTGLQLQGAEVGTGRPLFV